MVHIVSIGTTAVIISLLLIFPQIGKKKPIHHFQSAQCSEGKVYSKLKTSTQLEYSIISI